MGNFTHSIIIGAQRSGSTLLYHLLDRHPKICMAKPLRPEPKFFLNFNLDRFWHSSYLNTFFKHRNDELVLCEKSTSYLENLKAAENIKQHLPNAKIIVILRNPVYRAISNYYFSKESGLETRSLDEVFKEKKNPPMINKIISVNPFDYLERGNYQKYLDVYVNYFSKKQVKILILEELIFNKSIDKSLFSFLGINNISIEKSFFENKINFTMPKGKLNSEVISYLYDYYFKFNDMLKNKYDVNINYWK